MNALARAILAESISGSAAEIVAAFAGTVSLPHDHTRWTYIGVAAEFGEAAAEGIVAAMTAAGLNGAAIAFAATGFDLANQKTQDQLTAIAAAVPALASVCNALRAKGRPSQIRWQKCGLPSAPNEAQVIVALNQILVDTWVQAAKTLIDQLNNSGESTIATIKTAISELV